MSRTNPRPLVSAVTAKFFGISNLISLGLGVASPLRLGAGTAAATPGTAAASADGPSSAPFARTRASMRSSRHSRANLSSKSPIYLPRPPTMTSFLSSERLEDFTSAILIAIRCPPVGTSRTQSTATLTRSLCASVDLYRNGAVSVTVNCKCLLSELARNNRRDRRKTRLRAHSSRIRNQGSALWRIRNRYHHFFRLQQGAFP